MRNRFPARLDVDEFCTVNRRTLLRGLGAAALLTATGGLFRGGVWASPVFAASPFSLGVAAGDPAPDGFVIWTKIAPRPLERSGGMPRKPVEVDWAVATDERMRQVVQKGTATAHPELGHAVHVEVGGLEPGQRLFLPIHHWRRAQPHGPCADAAAGGSTGGTASLRRGRVPAL